MQKDKQMSEGGESRDRRERMKGMAWLSHQKPPLPPSFCKSSLLMTGQLLRQAHKNLFLLQLWTEDQCVVVSVKTESEKWTSDLTSQSAECRNKQLLPFPRSWFLEEWGFNQWGTRIWSFCFTPKLKECALLKGTVQHLGVWCGDTYCLKVSYQ